MHELRDRFEGCGDGVGELHAIEDDVWVFEAVAGQDADDRAFWRPVLAGELEQSCYAGGGGRWRVPDRE